VSVGEDLAEARRRAGLTVTEVSQRTRIRETLVRGIEHDDYAGCGGDFYVRGDIRAIARVVGADPEPLIRDYDAAHREPETATAADLIRTVKPVRIAERRPNWTTVLGLALALVLGLGVYHVISARGRAPGAASEAGHGPHRVAPPSAPATTPGPTSHAHEVVVQLTAVQDCWVEFTTPSGRYLLQAYLLAGASKRWTFRHTVDMRLGNPAGVRLSVDGTNPLPPGTTHPITLSLRARPGG
jgi:cytoskeletal protein RodZ